MKAIELHRTTPAITRLNGGRKEQRALTDFREFQKGARVSLQTACHWSLPGTLAIIFLDNLRASSLQKVTAFFPTYGAPGFQGNIFKEILFTISFLMKRKAQIGGDMFEEIASSGTNWTNSWWDNWQMLPWGVVGSGKEEGGQWKIIDWQGATRKYHRRGIFMRSKATPLPICWEPLQLTKYLCDKVWNIKWKPGKQ